MLSARGLTKRFGARRVLDGVDLDVPLDGRIHGLFGPNGAGKTTLFRCLLGLEPCPVASVKLDEHDLSRLTTDRIVRLGVALMFQRPAGFEGLSVLEHLALLFEPLAGQAARSKAEAVLHAHEL